MQNVQVTANVPVKETGIKPLGLTGSLVIFGVPALLLFLSFHLGYPALESIGLTSYEAFIVSNTIPWAVMFAVAVAAITAEQSITNLAEFREVFRTRLRFPRLTFRAILLSVGMYVVILIVGVIATIISRLLIEAQLIPVPDNLPLLLDPKAQITTETLTAFVGGNLVGNWGIVLLFGIQLFFNIASEELWWRGYVLPRQELAFGRKTWLVHGLLWWGFHIFKWWELVTVLPITLILSYAAQRTKNNWVPTIAHLLANVLLVLIMVAAVLG
jgi:membrane protease YdiL (CAAX protease family)